MSIKRTCAISGAISFFDSAAICLHEQCANYPLTSSEEVGGEKQGACFVERLKRGIVATLQRKWSKRPKRSTQCEVRRAIQHQASALISTRARRRVF